MPFTHWTKGIRMYIALAIILITAESWLWAKIQYGSSSLMTIRLQEVYAWLAVLLLFMAVVIGPMLKVFPALPGKIVFREARRMVGIGAAWFGFLHAAITYIGLFKTPNPFSLAGAYQKSFLLGIIALVILLLLAFTSFDRAFHGMGIWWFRLHRLVYATVLIAMLHAFMIGSHATGLLELVVIGALGVVLLGLHIYLLFRQNQPPRLQLITIVYAVLLAAAIFNYGISQHNGYNFFLQHDQGGDHDEH